MLSRTSVKYLCTLIPRLLGKSDLTEAEEGGTSAGASNSAKDCDKKILISDQAVMFESMSPGMLGQISLCCACYCAKPCFSWDIATFRDANQAAAFIKKLSFIYSKPMRV